MVRRASLATLLIGVAALYIVGLSASGWANSFYSAAAQAGSVSWKAWFFGSLDGANSITVDKPPASLWVMGLSIRLFGLSSWSILVPEALEGVAAVGLLYATIRRVICGVGWRRRTELTTTAHWAALVGAAVMALTPVATLMFRFNNPDALMVLLMIAGAWCVVRATEHGSRRWLVGAGVAIGLAFLTKTLEAFLVLPGFVLAYAVAAPVRWRRKIVDLLAAFAAMIVSAGWWVAIVELWPASSRPYIGGSQTNSFLELTFGYNGFGRITGNETGSVTGGGTGGAGSWGSTGLLRLFEGVSGGMVTWLIPAALLLLVAALVLAGQPGWANLRAGAGTTSTPRTQAVSGILALGGWLVVTYLTFAFMSGIYHDYYTVALAPAIGASTAIGRAICWSSRQRLVARLALAASSAVTTVWAVVLLRQAGSGWVWAQVLAVVLGALATIGLALSGHRTKVALTALVLGTCGALVGPAGYAVNTASTPHTGSIVTAGPVSGMGGPGGHGGPGGGRGGFQPGGAAPNGTAPGGSMRNGTGPGGTGQNGMPGGTPPNGTAPNGTSPNGTAPNGSSQGGTAPGGTGQGGTGTSQGNQGLTGGREFGATGGRQGGMFGETTVSSAMTTLLDTNSSSYTWVAAAIGSQSAASYQLATQHPVMAIGGFNGSDPSPTLAEFKALVAQKKIHYFIAGGIGGQQNGGSNAASEISAWVMSTFTAKTVGGVTVYDLTGGAS